MKICFCIDSLNGGGAERVVATLSNQLVQMGHQIDVMMIAKKEKDSFYKLDTNVKLHALCEGINRKISIFKRIKILRYFFKKNRPQVIISFLPHSNIFVTFATRGLDILHIVSERNNPYLNPQNKILRVLKKIAFLKAHGCVFQTCDARDFYPKKIKDKSAIIFNPVSIELKDETDVFRRNYILSVGRLTKQKNFPLLLKSFAEFHNKFTDYKLLIYGNGEERTVLEDITNRLNISENVEFKGHAPCWHKEAYDAKMFVLSSDYEGMPNALIEAMVLGIPCISTDCPIGGPRELIRDGENGYLTTVGDVGELSARMIEIANSESIAVKFSMANENLKEQLSAENISKQWLEFIKKLYK